VRTSLLKKLILIALFLTLSRSAYAVTYAGSLQVPSTSGVSGTGLWAEVFKISWSITQQPDTSWNYSYSLTELNGDPLDPGAVSHFILEISPAATASDFWGFGGATEIKTFSSADGNSNPNMPGSLYAIKFDYTATTYNFSSTKAPVWGDFYSKDGNAGGKGTNSVWNADFLDPDPLDAPKTGLLSDGNGGYIYKLLRPDTTNGGGGGSTPSVPEPFTSVMVGLGLAIPAAKKFLRSKRTK
jgi:hypothetical protein